MQKRPPHCTRFSDAERPPHFSAAEAAERAPDPDFSPLADPPEDTASDPAPRLRLVSSHNRAPRRNSPRPAYGGAEAPLLAAHLASVGEEWMDWCQIAGQSQRTIALRRMLLGRLRWFVAQQNYETVGTLELRRFFAYLQTAHQQPEGRWGYGDTHKCREPLRPATIATYDRHLSAFFAWLVQEGLLSASPMQAVPRARLPHDQIDPFTEDQVRALLQVAQRSRYPRRNEAIIRLLLDTGMRAGELCGLRYGDVDLFEARARILGKGNKYRTVRWGLDAARALRAYVKSEYYSATGEANKVIRSEDPLFLAERGTGAGEGITPNGLRQLISKMGRRAGIQISRCSPHTFRHTFAVMFLRGGGSVESLQQILGHTTLAMTMRYVKMARADVERQQRQFSPGDRLNKQP